MTHEISDALCFNSEPTLDCEVEYIRADLVSDLARVWDEDQGKGKP